jgi:hypothetical protein
MKLSNVVLSTVTVAALGTALVSGCKKETASAPRAVASGALSPAETDLLKHLPAGSQALFGGNMFKMQKWLAESPLAKLSQQVQEPKMIAYNACIAAESDNMQMVGSMTFGASGMVVRTYIKGFTIAHLTKCATDAKLSVEASDDGKFVAVTTETMHIKTTAPFLAVEGGVYGGNSLAKLGVSEVTAAPRDVLEAEVAGLAQSTALNDAKLQAMIAKIDRRANFWVAGNAANTPAAAKVGDFFVTFRMTDGLSLDGTVQIKDPADSSKLLKGVGDMKSHIDDIPANMSAFKEVVRGITAENTNDGVRVTLTVTNPQLEAITTQLGPMMAQFMPR